MHGGGMSGGGAWVAGAHAWWGHAWQGVCVAEGACMAGEMATAAGGTHPTGMRSCLSSNESINNLLWKNSNGV